MIPTKQNLNEDILNDVLAQYQDSPNVIALLSALASALSTTQTDIFNFINGVDVDVATGNLLDLLGKIVGEGRNGRDDDEYRGAIKLRRLLNTSDGVPNKLLEAVYLATDAEHVRMWEHFPYQCTFYTDGSTVPLRFAKDLRNSSPATSGEVVVYYDPLQSNFIAAELQDEIADLIDQDNNDIVDNEDDNIAVRDRLAPFSNKSLLSEYTYGLGSGDNANTKDGRGIMCDILMDGKGINDESVYE